MVFDVYIIYFFVIVSLFCGVIFFCNIVCCREFMILMVCFIGNSVLERFVVNVLVRVGNSLGNVGFLGWVSCLVIWFVGNWWVRFLIGWVIEWVMFGRICVFISEIGFSIIVVVISECDSNLVDNDNFIVIFYYKSEICDSCCLGCLSEVLLLFWK